MFLVKREYFNKTKIIKGLIIALLFSAFIYLDYFGYINRTLNSIIALFSIYYFLISSRQTLFYCGFFIGIFWFYWVGISFQYYNLTYLGPFVVLIFALFYGFVFLFISLFEAPLIRIILLFFLSFIHPFGFNWFIPELIFVNSWFPITKEAFALILASVYMLIKLNGNLRLLAIIPLLVSYFLTTNITVDKPNLSISMPQLNLKQDEKWNRKNIPNVIKMNFDLINQAILEDKDLIILPETAFPLVINKDNFTSYNLLEKSKYINIIAGGIYMNNKSYYNATYFFSKGKMQIAKKVVLVPFGEKIPLPKFIVDFINKTFFNGANDYESAKSPTDFIIDGTKFRNAICYEATSKELFQNLKDTKYMIAISNNAWFTPSIEPTLQKLLLTYYAKKYNIMIFHSVNGSKNAIIKP